MRGNTEKYITFSIPINIECDNDKTVTYKLKFIDSYRFMPSSLSSLVDNLSEINNKRPTGEFIDNIRSMVTSLSYNADNLSEINKKNEKSENKFIDNFRSMQCKPHYHILLMIYLRLIIKNRQMNSLIILDLCKPH